MVSTLPDFLFLYVWYSLFHFVRIIAIDMVGLWELHETDCLKVKV